jgi:hypothetical protein
MGVNRVFFPQEALDEWLEQGRITLVGDELTVHQEGRRFVLQGALRFVAEVADNQDPHDLVGRVKTLEQVQALEGEHCADSVILGDNAYQVVEGFLGEPLPQKKVSPRRSLDAQVVTGEGDPLNRLMRQK